MMEQSRLSDHDPDMKDESEEDWTFNGADTKYMTHGLHPYPARMIPQIARRLIHRYSKPGDTIWDPFCGSGSTLVESMLAERKSIGTDLNPFAVFLSKVKTTPIDIDILRKTRTKVLSRIRKLKASIDEELEIPKMHNPDLWFKKYVQQDLVIVKTVVDAIEDEPVRDFYRLCLASTARDTSNLKKSEFKIVRMKEEEQKKFNPDVFKVFADNIERCIPLMHSFVNALPKKYSRPEIIYIDNREVMFEENSIDLIVTSPPYGDHSTTVAYGQFSRYPAHWIDLDYDAVRSVDRRALGGTTPREYKKDLLKSKSLDETYQKILSNSEKRAKDFFNFFFDYNQSIESMYTHLKAGGHACIVIGNRLMARVRIPTAQITAELGQSYGFEHIVSIPRDIPTKRMPWQTAPENIEGNKADTMHNELIVILQKK